MMKALLLALIVGTWNGNWFPSGRAHHNAHPEVEDATIRASARMLAKGFRKADTNGAEDVILIVNEVRNREIAERLAAATGWNNLRVAAVSGYRKYNGKRLDQQQDVILTTLPVVASGWRPFAEDPTGTPPRGYAYATVVIDPATTARVCAVHLKSNYGATTPEIAADNRRKRANAVAQLLAAETNGLPMIVAGDFNADKWRKEFAEDTVFMQFESAGFTNLLELLPPRRRGTFPSERYGDSALDYIYVRGLEPAAMPFLLPNEELSDHFALMTQVRPPTGNPFVPPVRRAQARPPRRSARPPKKPAPVEEKESALCPQSSNS